MTELDGTSVVATYGPPYTNTPGAAQKLGPISLEQAAGARIPINTAQDFVLGPLATLPDRPASMLRSRQYEGASSAQTGDVGRRLREGRRQRELLRRPARREDRGPTGRSASS